MIETEGQNNNPRGDVPDPKKEISASLAAFDISADDLVSARRHPSTDLSTLPAERCSSIEDVRRILGDHRGVISSQGVRVDLIERHLSRGGEVYFYPAVPIANLRLEQGWTRDGVLSMINRLFDRVGIDQIAELAEVPLRDVSNTRSKLAKEIPPIIVRQLPEGIVDLDDGNHRWGVCHLLGIQAVPGFLLVARE